MKYVCTIDGKVFATEKECLEYEHRTEQKLERERIEQEKLKKYRRERQNHLDNINKKYYELNMLIREYRKKYGTRLEGYFNQYDEFIKMLHSW